MIHTSKQLKAKVRNVSHGDNQTAQMLIRYYGALSGKSFDIPLSE